MCKRISKKNCKAASNRAEALIKDVRTEVKDRYKFVHRLVGSGKWGTMVANQSGHYDLDYQIVLTHNSKFYMRDSSFKNPTQIKSDFLKAFNKFKSEGEEFQDSTTAITLVNKDKKQPYTIDFVIIDGTPFFNNKPTLKQIIKRNNNEKDNRDNKTWNELPDVPHAYEYFETLTPKEKQFIIEKRVIPRKAKEKQKTEQSTSSYEIFVQEILLYEQKNTRKNS